MQMLFGLPLIWSVLLLHLYTYTASYQRRTGSQRQTQSRRRVRVHTMKTKQVDAERPSHPQNKVQR